MARVLSWSTTDAEAAAINWAIKTKLARNASDAIRKALYHWLAANHCPPLTMSAIETQTPRARRDSRFEGKATDPHATN